MGRKISRYLCTGRNFKGVGIELGEDGRENVEYNRDSSDAMMNFGRERYNIFYLKLKK